MTPCERRRCKTIHIDKDAKFHATEKEADAHPKSKKEYETLTKNVQKIHGISQSKRAESMNFSYLRKFVRVTSKNKNIPKSIKMHG